MSDNKVMGLPDKLRFFPSLSIIEVGNNRLKDMKSIEVIQHLRNLYSFGIKGNPLAEDEELLDKINQLNPRITIINNQKFERKVRQKDTSFLKKREAEQQTEKDEVQKKIKKNNREGKVVEKPWKKKTDDEETEKKFEKRGEKKFEKGDRKKFEKGTEKAVEKVEIEGVEKKKKSKKEKAQVQAETEGAKTFDVIKDLIQEEVKEEEKEKKKKAREGIVKIEKKIKKPQQTLLQAKLESKKIRQALKNEAAVEGWD